MPIFLHHNMLKLRGNEGIVKLNFNIITRPNQEVNFFNIIIWLSYTKVHICTYVQKCKKSPRAETCKKKKKRRGGGKVLV